MGVAKSQESLFSGVCVVVWWVLRERTYQQAMNRLPRVQVRVPEGHVVARGRDGRTGRRAHKHTPMEP